jgi:tetratricopeptide (TPR) repeat protein
MLTRLKRLVAGSMLVFAATAALAVAQQVQKPCAEAKQHYLRAEELFDQGEKEKALDELKAAIQLAPDYVEPQRELIDRQRDKAASLIDRYEADVKAHSDSALHHYLLGKVYSVVDKQEKADAEFKRALELDPDFAWVMVPLSDSAKRNGDGARIAELLDRASKNAGDSVVLRNMIATRFTNNKMYDRAIDEANRILKIDAAYYDAYLTRWSARLNITFGAEDTRKEVLREIQDLESKHSREVSALVAARSAYEMLDDTKAAGRAKAEILAADPKYFDRQGSAISVATSSGKMIRFTGANARLLSDIWEMKDDKQKLDAYTKLEKQTDDRDAKFYIIYPPMIEVCVAVKDMNNAERLLDLMAKGNVDTNLMVEAWIAIARGYGESRTKRDTALEHVQKAIKQLRMPAPKPEKSSSEDDEYAREHFTGLLADALAIEGKILLSKGMATEAAVALAESVSVREQEESLLDLGLADARAGKKQEAVDALSRAYAFEGKRQKEARSELAKIYPTGPGSKKLTDVLAEAVARHKEHEHKVAIEKAAVELAKTKPEAAPLFALATLAGRQVQLSDFRGKVVLLSFWASW